MAKEKPVSSMPNECCFFLFCCSLYEFTTQVPSLEHNNEVRGESLDLIKYIDSHFEGPSLFPHVRFGDKTLLFIYQQPFVKFLYTLNCRIQTRKNLQKSCCPTVTRSIELWFLPSKEMALAMKQVSWYLQLNIVIYNLKITYTIL